MFRKKVTCLNLITKSFNIIFCQNSSSKYSLVVIYGTSGNMPSSVYLEFIIISKKIMQEYPVAHGFWRKFQQNMDI